MDDGRSLNRGYYTLAAEAIGPRFYRVYASDSAYSPSYKHVIEPKLVYQYIPRITDQLLVPIMDERDPAVGDLNLVTFSIVNRVFAKRPPKLELAQPVKTPEGWQSGGSLPWSSFPAPVTTPPPAAPVPAAPEPAPAPEEPGAEADGGAGLSPVGGAGSEPLLPAGSPSLASSSSGPPAGQSPASPSPAPPESSPSRPPATAPPGAPAAAASAALSAMEANPVEIFSVELGQSYSFGIPLTTIFEQTIVCADGSAPPCAGGGQTRPGIAVEGTRAYSPVQLTAHFNPAMTFSVDLRTDYDLANSSLVATALSGWYRWASGYANASWSRQTFPGSLVDPLAQLRAGAGGYFFNRKLTLDAEVGYDFRRSASLDRRARVGYYTQCCGFMAEYLERNFETDLRREIRFVIDLKGIGRFLDPNMSLSR